MIQSKIQNRITRLFEKKDGQILSIFFTAGYPELDNTEQIILELDKAGADLIEVGIPFSDPIADGPTIQASNQVALQNGITLEQIFAQLEGIRKKTEIPILLMGYVNPVLQYGLEKFCKDAARVGVDGVILPDLPMQEFLDEYSDLFARHQLSNIFLVTPQTTEDRIRLIDKHSQGFIYAVSTDSTTGKTEGFGEKETAYFQRLKEMNLENPFLIGFGISNHETFSQATSFAQGAIIGSAFIKALKNGGVSTGNIQKFINRIRRNVN
ncbi:MAG: tryptophan synthase subunit alpha [Bacteroidetes bacterium]|nr:tryptophan synthase subunit alpha [Bacteroidota bacterium]MCB0843702.1 tryptophan synthase subunit alpha [Bacteroidota bacterium]